MFRAGWSAVREEEGGEEEEKMEEELEQEGGGWGGRGVGLGVEPVVDCVNDRMRHEDVVKRRLRARTLG